jgi:hypothetical protein
MRMTFGSLFCSGDGVLANALMEPGHIKKYCRPDDTGEQLLAGAVRQLRLSALAYHRILKVARTIADLDQKEAIAPDHLLETIQYRSLDRTMFCAGERDPPPALLWPVGREGQGDSLTLSRRWITGTSCLRISSPCSFSTMATRMYVPPVSSQTRTESEYHTGQVPDFR